MNAILFNDSVVVRSSKSGNATYNNNTGVANYSDDSENIAILISQKMKIVLLI